MLKNLSKKIKIKIQQHFEIDNLANILLRFLKNSLLIGFGEIHDGILIIKNPIQYLIYFIIYNGFWIMILTNFLFLISKYFYSIIYSPFLFDGFKMIIICQVFFLIHISIVKTDILSGELKYHLSQFKIGYFLAKNIKSKHKLTEQNYNRWAIAFRFYFIIVLYLAFPITSLVIIMLESILIIGTKKLIWFLEGIFLTPFYINGVVVLLTTSLIIVCLILYYKIRFDQLHYQIKSIIPNGKVINKRREKILLDLIHQHNQLAIEINKLKMMVRRSFASQFINFSLIKIITLYLMFTSKDLSAKFFSIISFASCFISESVINNSLSLQIESAHQNLKFIHFAVCRYKMRFKLRLKVRLKLKLKYKTF